jgi:putative hydrolase of the HAD superfamily
VELRLPAFDAVLFDLDSTLLDGETAWEVGLTRLLERCPRVDRARARLAWSEGDEMYFPRYLSGELTMDEHRTARMRWWAGQLNVEIAPGAELDWFAVYRAGYEAGWCAYSDVAPCLAALASLPKAIITNGDSVQQHRKVDVLGIRPAFKVVLASGDIGIAKPDPRIFRHAAQALGVEPRRCVYVGDKRDTDAQAATAAGMTGIWLNRAKRPAPDTDVVLEIATLADLL